MKIFNTIVYSLISLVIFALLFLAISYQNDFSNGFKINDKFSAYFVGGLLVLILLLGIIFVKVSTQKKDFISKEINSNNFIIFI